MFDSAWLLKYCLSIAQQLRTLSPTEGIDCHFKKIVSDFDNDNGTSSRLTVVIGFSGLFCIPDIK